MVSIKEFPRGIPAGTGGALCIDPEAGTDQAISDSTATANDSVRPGPGYKLQATSCRRQATSVKRQAKRQATSAVCHPNRQATGKAFRDDRS